MTAMTAPQTRLATTVPVHDKPTPQITTRHALPDAARRWLVEHHPELVRRARLRHGHLDPEARDEAIAETLAYTTQAVQGAAGRGTLDRLTPGTCVRFAGKHIDQGRRVAGSSSRCPLSRECQRRHGIHTHSIDADPKCTSGDHADADFDNHEVIANLTADQPFDVVRRRLDFPRILNREAVSPKARATFRFFAETHGSGKQTDLAGELMVSPARITQMKAELARALGTDDYHGPLGRRPR